MKAISRKTRVAVLGGGPAAIAAVYSLLNGKDAEAYEITVYQENTQLGGKCASFTANSPTNHRIYEHGLHVLMGFYDVSLSWIHDMYREIAKGPFAKNLPTVKQIFKPANSFTLCENPDDAGWQYWTLPFPENKRPIGDKRQSLHQLIGQGLRAFLKLRRALAKQHGGHYQHLRLFLLEVLLILLLGLMAIGSVLKLLHWSRLFSGLRRFIAREMRNELHRIGVKLDENKGVDNVTRQLAMCIGFVGVNLCGILQDELYLPPNDLRSINDQDYKDWLKHHNVAEWPEDLSWNSVVVNALYQLPFSNGTSMAAGTTLHTVMRLGMGYAGHVAYHITLGMGDAVFAPAYLLLKDKVDFKFFHQVCDVVPDETNSSIKRVSIKAYDLDKNFQPLRKIAVGDNEWFSWADCPTRSPQCRTLELEAGHDFDVLILGMSVGSFPSGCPSLLSGDAKFAQMGNRLKTRGTSSLQLWFNKPLCKLGFPKDASHMGLPFTHPFNSWSNKSYEIDNEGWKGQKPEALVYFANELDESTENPSQEVFQQMQRFVENDLSDLLSDFTVDDLFAPNATSTKERLEAQYWRANTVGSERYVLLEAGTQHYRLGAGDSGYTNMALAGDWVQTDLNSGCFEAAVMAGQDAAQAIVDGVVRPANDLPRYVATDNDWVWSPPGILQDTSMSFFVLRADYQAIEDLCDRLITRPSGGAVTATPMIPNHGVVVLNCVNIGKGYSDAPNFADRGYTKEKECAFFVPVTITDAEGSKRGMLIPYIFVDNVAAVLIGREVYGAPKVSGTLVFDEAARDFSVEAIAIKSYDPNSEVTSSPIVSISSTSNTNSEKHSAESGHGPLEWIARRALQGVGTEPDVENLSEIPLVFLKQFRDVTDPSGACYQAITYSRSKITEVMSAELWPAHEFTIQLPAYDSVGIAKNLGLGGTEITPVLAGNVKLNFTLPPGKAIWQANIAP